MLEGPIKYYEIRLNQKAAVFALPVKNWSYIITIFLYNYITLHNHTYVPIMFEDQRQVARTQLAIQLK